MVLIRTNMKLLRPSQLQSKSLHFQAAAHGPVMSALPYFFIIIFSFFDFFHSFFISLFSFFSSIIK